MAKVESLDGSGVRNTDLTKGMAPIMGQKEILNYYDRVMQSQLDQQRIEANNQVYQNEAAADVSVTTSNIAQGAMDDGGVSDAIKNNAADTVTATKGENGYNINLGVQDYDFVRVAKHTAGLFDQEELDPFNQRFRFGWIDPYNTVSTAREYLFFTKPDLNIIDPSTGALVPYLRTKSYWTELYARHPEVIKQLELSLDSTNVFNNLLGNTVLNVLEVPPTEAQMIDTPSNMYGVSYTYRGSSESSDNNPTFSLEFRDTRFLPVYNFFKAYEDYETIKHHGHLKPMTKYLRERSLYDQYSIYKFMVAEDGETILYYGKYYGVKSKNLPRDVFSNVDFSNGLSYSIEFGAAFYDDMKPYLLAEFNKLYEPMWNIATYELSVHNTSLDRPDTRPGTCARIYRVKSNQAPGGYVYKLKWKGVKQI